ncbi:hypothetical protein FQR65_LT16096 [Abscondita terminalis]|nr:hypothetical protein FQR65_LT16096 [Abscondita terminalis]
MVLNNDDGVSDLKTNSSDRDIDLPMAMATSNVTKQPIEILSKNEMEAAGNNLINLDSENYKYITINNSISKTGFDQPIFNWTTILVHVTSCARYPQWENEVEADLEVAIRDAPVARISLLPKRQSRSRSRYHECRESRPSSKANSRNIPKRSSVPREGRSLRETTSPEYHRKT